MGHGCQVPGSGYRVARIQTLPILHRASCILHPYLNKAVDPRAKEILGQEGHEVLTVQEQGLSGASDAQVATTAQREGYCLVTLDLDFANPLAFPPHLYAGIIVLRHPKPTTKRLLQLVEQLTQVLRTENPKGRLWIIEPGRLRIYEPASFPGQEK
jgi:predicted nuclease of predicted toxin-antitoxin system